MFALRLSHAKSDFSRNTPERGLKRYETHPAGLAAKTLESYWPVQNSFLWVVLNVFSFSKDVY